MKISAVSYTIYVTLFLWSVLDHTQLTDLESLKPPTLAPAAAERTVVQPVPEEDEETEHVRL